MWLEHRLWSLKYLGFHPSSTTNWSSCILHTYLEGCVWIRRDFVKKVIFEVTLGDAQEFDVDYGKEEKSSQQRKQAELKPRGQKALLSSRDPTVPSFSGASRT